MIATDEDALICDLAETYQIYDYRSLPARFIATLSMGLREDSRIKMIMNDEKVPIDTFLLCLLLDKFNAWIWMNTEDGQKGINRPKSIAESLLNKDKDSDIQSFTSVEEFENARKAILLGGM